MEYKLVIFDFDGTLADSFPWFLDVFNEVAEKFDLRKIPPGEVERLRGYGSRRALAHFGVPRWKLPRIAAHMRRLAARDRRRIHLFEGVDALLNALAARGIVLAIASSNTEENIRAVLGARNAALITHWACGASLFGKASKFRRIVKASGLARENVICIGDEVRDAEAARVERIAFGAVGWGYARLETLEALGPDLVFERLEEIAERVAPCVSA